MGNYCLQLNLVIQDEDIYTFFEPELPVGPSASARAKMANPMNKNISNHLSGKGGIREPCNKNLEPFLTSEKRFNSDGNENWWSMMREKMTLHEGSSVLDLKGDNYFSCAVGRKCSSARYLLGSSADVVSLLKDLSDSS